MAKGKKKITATKAQIVANAKEVVKQYMEVFDHNEDDCECACCRMARLIGMRK